MNASAPATVLLTGATGYIASHTWLALWDAGFEVVGIDDFTNSSPVVLERLAELGGRKPTFLKVDVRDAQAMRQVFAEHRLDAVVHFAALKAVGESTQKPLEYYANNLGGLLNLCFAMREHGCRSLVFSSSATVYGDPQQLPITEEAPLKATNPYGATKLMSEDILRDLVRSDATWKVALLRYFNPVGAHPSGRMGEDPSGIPNNLMPYVTQVAVGKRAKLQVFGNDYPTADGTGVRDYIHVTDLARAHVAALARFETLEGAEAYNIGTGHGISVKEMLTAFNRAVGRDLPFEIHPRRPGDIAEMRADASKANRELDWRAEYDVDDMVQSLWAWQSANPYGYSAPQEG